MKSTDKNRAARGEAQSEFIGQYSSLPDDKLAALLASFNPQERTAAAKILGERRCISAVIPLCETLKKEKALYTKIAITETLASIGEPAMPELVKLLGEVGNNQHKALPDLGFYKISYPLPHDIAARTIMRIGAPALKYLKFVIESGERRALLEAIDAAGHISFYFNDKSLEEVLIKTYHKFSDDNLIKWKLIRAFESFQSERVNKILTETILNNASPQLRWEAIRSLALNKGTMSEKLKQRILSDPDPEVRKTGKRFCGDKNN